MMGRDIVSGMAGKDIWVAEQISRDVCHLPVEYIGQPDASRRH